jgi:2-C-methyl-D-erythritol 2,4-cyclodiphosphate synthase
MTYVSDAGFGVANVDVVVIAQKPKLVPYVDAIRANLAGALDCDVTQVSVKGKTNEGVDSMGAGESIAVHAVALLYRTWARDESPKPRAQRGPRAQSPETR